MNAKQHVAAGMELQAQKLTALECYILQRYMAEASTREVAVLKQAFGEAPPGYIGPREIEVAEPVLLEFLLPYHSGGQRSV
jgi:hypothetical protein